MCVDSRLRDTTLKPAKLELRAAASSTSLARIASTTSLASTQTQSASSASNPDRQGQGSGGLLPGQLTEIEMLARQIEEASAQGNGPLVKLRLQDLLERCSIAKATVKRQGAMKTEEAAAADLAEGEPNSKKKSWWSHIPSRGHAALCASLRWPDARLNSR